MQGILVVGRILFVLVFIVSGVQKMMDLDGTAQKIEQKVTLPAAISGLTAKVTTATGLSTPKLLAIVSGAVEVIGGLLIVFGIGTRLAALVLIVFVGVVTFYFHDFWNMAEPDRTANIAHVLKNLSMIGGLLVLFAFGSRPLVSRAPVEVLE
ncbi:MAG: DoxX family protein [Xanthobacteraceae bacterium]|jgi:putative oxidoreductase